MSFIISSNFFFLFFFFWHRIFSGDNLMWMNEMQTNDLSKIYHDNRLPSIFTCCFMAQCEGLRSLQKIPRPYYSCSSLYIYLEINYFVLDKYWHVDLLFWTLSIFGSHFIVLTVHLFISFCSLWVHCATLCLYCRIYFLHRLYLLSRIYYSLSHNLYIPRRPTFTVRCVSSIVHSLIVVGRESVARITMKGTVMPEQEKSIEDTRLDCVWKEWKQIADRKASKQASRQRVHQWAGFFQSSFLPSFLPFFFLCIVTSIFLFLPSSYVCPFSLPLLHFWFFHFLSYFPLFLISLLFSFTSSSPLLFSPFIHSLSFSPVRPLNGRQGVD